MKTYTIYPEGTLSLGEVMLPKDYPASQFFQRIGRIVVFEGRYSFRVGTIHYSPDPDFINVLNIRGDNFSIEMPITAVDVGENETIFKSEDPKIVLRVDRNGFKLDIGETKAP